MIQRRTTLVKTELPTVPVQENIPDFLVLCGLTTVEVAWLSGFTQVRSHATLTRNPLAAVGQKRRSLAQPTPSLCPGRKRTSSPLRLTLRRGVARVLRAQPHPTGCYGRTGCLQPGGGPLGRQVRSRKNERRFVSRSAHGVRSRSSGSNEEKTKTLPVLNHFPVREATEAIPASEHGP